MGTLGWRDDLVDEVSSDPQIKLDRLIIIPGFKKQRMGRESLGQCD